MFLILKNEQEVLNKLQSLIEEIANESIAARQTFFIGFSGKAGAGEVVCRIINSVFSFSGGSLGKYLCTILPNIKTDWSKWTVFFCDERYVPDNDTESTFG